MRKLLDATADALGQMLELIRAVEAFPDTSRNVYEESGIGRHVRHVVDHFRALEVGSIKGLVNYNTRNRMSPVEKQAQAGAEETEKLIGWLQTSSMTLYGLVIETEISCRRTENVRSPSNTHRELLYLINHAIHHTAYAALLAQQYSIDIAPSIGQAPATLSYLRKQQDRGDGTVAAP